MIIRNTNYKEQLNKYFHTKYDSHIIFSEPSIEGGLNNKIYTVNVIDKESHILGIGIGKSKKKAEQYACKDTLEKLNIIDT